MVELTFDDSELQARLREFIDKGLTDSLYKGLEKACLIIEAEAKVKCPVDDGQLRQSITHEVDKENLQGIIGSALEYAPYVEVGTGIYSKEGNGRKDGWSYEDAKGEWHYTMGAKPKPFLSPAAEEKKEAVMGAFEGLI